MMSSFLGKMGGWFDRDFMLGWWFPTLVAGGLALLLGAGGPGLGEALAWWEAHPGLTQTWLLAGGLFLVTLVAYLLQVFTRPLVQLYEGYWPASLRRDAMELTGLEARWQEMQQEMSQAAGSDPARYRTLQDRLHHSYPSRAELLLPTGLGNTLRAAEEYPFITYGMDAAFWWPRLWTLLPEAMRQEVQSALTPMLALLNLSAELAVLSLAGPIYLAICQRWWLALGALLLLPLLAALAYSGAVAQARSYGQTLRAAVDLHRFELLKALRQPLPASPREERALWPRLADWLYNRDRGAAAALSYQHPPIK